MNKKIKIFGYGSLVNIDSLKKTVESVESITPVILRNYIRVFDTKSTKRFGENNKAICVLNIQENPKKLINGVCFEVSQDYFEALIERENAYNLKEVIVESFIDQKKDSAFMFVGKSLEQYDFLFDNDTQIAYLQTCIKWAKDFWEDFYKMFLETTLINNKKLIEIKEISHLL